MSAFLEFLTITAVWMPALVYFVTGLYVARKMAVPEWAGLFIVAFWLPILVFLALWRRRM